MISVQNFKSNSDLSLEYEYNIFCWEWGEEIQLKESEWLQSFSPKVHGISQLTLN